MPKKISESLVQAILDMQKDPSKLEVELKVHIFSFGEGKPHAHFKVTSPFTEENVLCLSLENILFAAALVQKIPLANGNYVFRQSLVDGTKCVNEGVSEKATVEWLLQNGVTQILTHLSRLLAEALADWPKDLATKQMLAAGYSDIMRKKLERGTGKDPITVYVIGRAEEAFEKLQSITSSFHVPLISKPLLDQSDKIVIVAFKDDTNPCSPVVRQAYAAYATEILNKEIEPEIGPKIVERVQLALNTLATRLARQQATSENVSAAPTVVSGVVADGKTEEVAAPAENERSSIGAAA
ncbi:hypothetical protein A2318_04080 [Candidatus Uhrbacteria bacterium RIFOXYB2_FULL_45_11]|uniref:Uncharacterized protein n=1 Tax=Candidatus Uhrbacteria bacterium RIFOXYB2_FULL_45_11 TaxID=1802421 RepID=A0A1F7W219_9BACT|nr:MAG: hypothetical protein A2318_04080 [Candidatus Uhrbacteria bacterium RIFOXYB2_FULL_45_11]